MSMYLYVDKNNNPTTIDNCEFIFFDGQKQVLCNKPAIGQHRITITTRTRLCKNCFSYVAAMLGIHKRDFEKIKQKH